LPGAGLRRRRLPGWPDARGWGVVMSAVVRMRWLAVLLAGLCVMALAPGAAGHAAASGGQARHVRAAAVPAGLAPPPGLRYLAGVGCFSAADCVAVGSDGGSTGGRSLAEQWNGRAWRPAGSPAGRFLSAVACPRARLCRAVGGERAERWNGRAWTAEKTPAALRGATLTAVACAAASACVAVGTRPGGRPPVAETWNGSAWAARNLTSPPGAVQASLSSVSCPGRSFCIAVGNYSVPASSSAGNGTLAEKWNGRTWTRLVMPSAVGTNPDLTGVSCVRPASCVAVGSDGVQPLAESWNGTRWTVLPAPPAAGAGTTAAVSCTAAASCMAIGSDGQRASATSWNGSTWKVLPTPRPAFLLTLTAVACPAAKRCMAAGYAYDANYGTGSFAMSWDGSAWRGLRVNHADELSGISCPRATWCMATGGYETASGRFVALTESWNGSSWRRRPASRARDSVLPDVSCASAARCIAVGAISNSATLAEAWNGTAWRVTPGAGQPAALTGPDAVSCRGRMCLALGVNGLSVWNGTAWHQVSSGLPAGAVFDVSCASPTYCMAAGAIATAPHGDSAAMADVWNGTSWQPPSYPPGTGLSTVSCTSASFCMAAAGNTAVIWNGTSWLTRNLPGSFGTGGPGITAVSCVRRSACMAVGNYVTQTGSRFEGFNVAEFWNGHRWRRLPTPGPGGGLRDVSCTSPSRCIAVGLSPAGPAGTRLLAERWNGRRWHLLPIPSP
jgi:hypothetical protein